jgi:glucose/arabinose dehydrogenase
MTWAVACALLTSCGDGDAPPAIVTPNEMPDDSKPDDNAPDDVPPEEDTPDDLPPDDDPPDEPEPEPPTEPALRFDLIALGLRAATDFVFLPGRGDQLLVTSQDGTVSKLQLGDGEVTLLGSTRLEVFYKDGCGLLSVALDPSYLDNGYVYLARCSDLRTSTLSRYELGELSELAASEAPIMTLAIDSDPPEIWHRWGSLGFEPDGETMWALHGDMFMREMAQDASTRQGSLLRFRPNREAGGAGYEPADGNAIDLLPEADPAVYAYGLRSPWRGYRDRSGNFWVGDVGLVSAEEVDLVNEPGQNLGWPRAEGACEEACEGLREPLLSFGRKSDEPYALEDPDTEPSTKRAVWMGVKYEEPTVDRYYGLLDDVVLYGDYFAGWVRGVKVDDDGALAVDRLLGHLPAVTSVRLGPDGYLYLLTIGGNLYRAEQVVP